MPDLFNPQRRALLGGAGLAAAQLALPSMAAAQGEASLGPIRQIRAGDLDVGYAQAGPDDGLPVLLMHGYPYDVHSYAEVSALLAARGYRVIVPHLRGHGSTRFLDAAAPRNAQQSAVALDQIALLDALGIERAVVAGFDWGARTACILAALWPERCIGMVSAGGYIVTNLANSRKPLPAAVEYSWWYQYYFATDNGRAGLAANRRDIARILWTHNSPRWRFDDAAFERAAASWDNPDYVDIVVHNYHWRLGLAPGERRYERFEERLTTRPVIGVPSITLDGAYNGIVAASDGKAFASRFGGPWSHRVVEAGHNVPQEAPQAFADAVQDVARVAG
ncbi:MAG: alpha/beta hydrolase [Paucibacter sp.]|nr:alpha/beta hydrolase [Roseateles sp.]